MYRNGVNVQHPGNVGYKKMMRRFTGKSEGRFWEIDFLRGICVILMIFDHLIAPLTILIEVAGPVPELLDYNELR